MTIPFADFFERLCSVTDIASQTDLAEALEVHRSAVTQAKMRNAVPQKWVLALSRRYGLSPDWLEYATGGAYDAPAFARPKAERQRPQNSVRAARSVLPLRPVESGRAGEDMVLVPKVSALLSAGGGSFEVDATPASASPFPRWWLARMGSPSDMVFMDVVGDSMEPTVYDGDTVLVDQGNTRLDLRSIFAVGVDEAIYLKRVETTQGGVILHSDNARYAPMAIFGDELEFFRVIGKMVWLCRDCR